MSILAELAAPLAAPVAACVAGAGVLQAALGLLLVWRFRRRPPTPLPAERPVTVLKPLFGDEPELEAALASICAQQYGPLQIVFGLQDPDDPARAVVDRLRARFPARDITLVIDGTPLGRNHKVANLANMLPAAKHDLLVIADSDVHAPPGYVTSLVAALEQPGIGLATTLYTGLPANGSIAASLGATGITHTFLPGALIARLMGRQDCLGATMALRRETLDAIGGFAALAPHIADDHVLGKLVRATGQGIALADTVPATTVPEDRLDTLFRHELRWGRTIASLVPVQFALSAIQYSLVWAFAALALSGGEEWGFAVFLATWCARAAIGRGVDAALAATGGATGGAVPVPNTPIWLLPLRDLLSLVLVIASYLGDKVEWRGRVIPVGAPQRGTPSRRALPIPSLPMSTLATASLPLGTEPRS